MNEIEIIDCQGLMVEKFKFNDEEKKVSDKNISLIRFHYLSNKKQETKKVKNRSEVKASTRKIVRQKGTGSARHGSLTAPQFRGGGVAFGPRGEKSKKLKINKKLKKVVFKEIIRRKNDEKELAIIEKIKMNDYKTKEANLILKSIISSLLKKKKEAGFKTGKILEEKNILLVLSKNDDKIREIKMSFRNIGNLNIVENNILNSYHLISNRWILLTKKALIEMQSKYQLINL